jgi:hypothetical protein
MNASLDRWIEQHALLMGLGIGAVWLERAPELLAAMAAASLLGLLRRGRGQFTTDGRFGLANGLTLARLVGGLGLLALPELSPWLQVVTLWLLVAADGLDGWAARRFGTVSPFGHLFDRECDALLLLVACVLLFMGGRLGAWIVLPGALHYGFLLYRAKARPGQHGGSDNRYTRAIEAMASLGFAVCLLPDINSEIRWALALGLTSALVASFLRAVIQLYRHDPVN